MKVVEGVKVYSLEIRKDSDVSMSETKFYVDPNEDGVYQEIFKVQVNAGVENLQLLVPTQCRMFPNSVQHVEL